MSPEADEYFNEIRAMLTDFLDEFGTLPRAHTADTVHDWLDHLDVLADLADRWLALNAMLNEFRRGYGHEVAEPAHLNQMIARIEQAGTMIPRLIRVCRAGLGRRFRDGP